MYNFVGIKNLGYMYNERLICLITEIVVHLMYSLLKTIGNFKLCVQQDLRYNPYVIIMMCMQYVWGHGKNRIAMFCRDSAVICA